MARWGVLRRPLTCIIQHTVALVRCCMRLHNLCIDERMPDVMPTVAEGDEPDVAKDGSDRFRAWRQSEGLAQPLTSGQRSARNAEVDTSMRKKLHDHILAMGLRRPATSKHGAGILLDKKKAKMSRAS